MKIELMVREYNGMIGLARYSRSLCEALNRASIGYTIVTPSYPLPARLAAAVLARFGYDLRTFFTTYPLAGRFSPDSIKHLTVQQMALLLRINPRLQPVIVTVHDIVPYLMRDDAEQNVLRHPVERLFERLAMQALGRADLLICDSQFTRQTVVEALGYPVERTAVVYLGVDHGTFRPRPVPDAFRQRLGLDGRFRHLLYVGSENPRKNLAALLEAFARLRERIPDVRLIKAGSNQHPAGVAQLKRQIADLGLTDAVLLHERLSDDDLALLYNAADLFVFPSLYEGFGLPPLEAMACGTPVVCSNSASLPEVVGDAALSFSPRDVAELTAAMEQLLADPALRADLRERGLARARSFTWERTAAETVAVYRQLALRRRLGTLRARLEKDKLWKT